MQRNPPAWHSIAPRLLSNKLPMGTLACSPPNTNVRLIRLTHPSPPPPQAQHHAGWKRWGKRRGVRGLVVVAGEAAGWRVGSTARCALRAGRRTTEQWPPPENTELLFIPLTLLPGESLSFFMRRESHPAGSPPARRHRAAPDDDALRRPRAACCRRPAGAPPRARPVPQQHHGAQRRP